MSTEEHGHARTGTDTEGIGARVRRLRLAAGLTQEALGSAVGITGQQVSNLERGLAVPKARTAQALAGVFGVGVEDFLERLDVGEGLDARMASLRARAEGPFCHLGRQAGRELAFAIPLLREAFDAGVREEWEARGLGERKPGTLGDGWLVQAGERAMSAAWGRLGKAARARLVAAAVDGGD